VNKEAVTRKKRVAVGEREEEEEEKENTNTSTVALLSAQTRSVLSSSFFQHSSEMNARVSSIYETFDECEKGRRENTSKRKRESRRSKSHELLQ
jgi:hypothetical protein